MESVISNEGSEDSLDIELNLIKDSITDLKNTCSEIRNNYRDLKESVLDFIPVIKDFKDLLQGRSLFDRGFFYLNTLAKEIKTNVLQEVNIKLSEPHDVVRDLRSEFNEFKDSNNDQHYEFKDNMDVIKVQLEQLYRNQIEMKDKISIFEFNVSDEFKDIKEDLHLKAPLSLLNKISETVDTKATIFNLNEIEETVRQKATSQELDLVTNKVDWLSQKFNTYASKDMLSDLEQTIIENIMGQIGEYCKEKDFIKEIEKVRIRIDESYRQIEAN